VGELHFWQHPLDSGLFQAQLSNGGQKTQIFYCTDFPYPYPEGTQAQLIIAIFLRASTKTSYAGCPLDKRKTRLRERLITLPGILMMAMALPSELPSHHFIMDKLVSFTHEFSETFY